MIFPHTAHNEKFVFLFAVVNGKLWAPKNRARRTHNGGAEFFEFPMKASAGRTVSVREHRALCCSFRQKGWHAKAFRNGNNNSICEKRVSTYLPEGESCVEQWCSSITNHYIIPVFCSNEQSLRIKAWARENWGRKTGGIAETLLDKSLEMRQETVEWGLLLQLSVTKSWVKLWNCLKFCSGSSLFTTCGNGKIKGFKMKFQINETDCFCLMLEVFYPQHKNSRSLCTTLLF